MTAYFFQPLFLCLAAGVLIVLGSGLFQYLYRTKRATLDAELKLEMLQRGMSADEICQVISAKASSPTKCGQDDD